MNLYIWDGAKRHLYINGAEVAADTMPLHQLIDSDGGLYFGAGKNLEEGSFWNGLIDDIRIYNKALNGTDIRRLLISGGEEVEGIEGFETGNFDNFDWRSYGDANWIISILEKNSGKYSARSGLIFGDESSSLEITDYAGEISFYRKVSSEEGCDYLRFYVDGSEKRKWSGNKDWEKVSYSAGEGTHTFKWHSKDSSVSDGYDAAWLDDVEFPRE